MRPPKTRLDEIRDDLIHLRDKALLACGWDGYWDWAAREIEKDEIAGKLVWPSKPTRKRKDEPINRN